MSSTFGAAKRLAEMALLAENLGLEVAVRQPYQIDRLSAKERQQDIGTD